jgi:hypothetical protein
VRHQDGWYQAVGGAAQLACVALLAALCAGCNSATDAPAPQATPPVASRPAPEASPPPASAPPSQADEATPRARSTSRSPSAEPAATDWDVDLRRDESRGGHTIARHVGRTDAQLRARLARESISAASTYVDLEAAERVVAEALTVNARRVRRWVDQRGPRSSLAIRYRARDGIPTGRLMRRGEDASSEVDSAVVVLRWRDDSYYVLTSYPEASR